MRYVHRELPVFADLAVIPARTGSTSESVASGSAREREKRVGDGTATGRDTQLYERFVRDLGGAAPGLHGHGNEPRHEHAHGHNHNYRHGHAHGHTHGHTHGHSHARASLRKLTMDSHRS